LEQPIIVLRRDNMSAIRNYRLFSILVIFSMILSVVSISSVAIATTDSLGIVRDVETPIQVNLSIDHYPAIGEPAQLKCEITTTEEAPGTTVDLELPNGSRLIDGNQAWTGDLHPDQPVELAATVAFDLAGDTSVFCRAHYQIDEQNSWGDLGELYFNVGATQGTEGYAEIPINDRVSITAMDRPGDGTLVESANNTYTPDLNAPAPPSVDAQQSAQVTSQPITPQGNLTVTGSWHYYDRNDVYTTEQMLVEIVRADNGAHLAYCFTGMDGTYSCGPFTNPYPVGVKSYWKSWTSFNPHPDILATQNPDLGTGTPGSIGAAFTAPTSAYVFTDGTHDFGSWQIVNGASSLERAFWITADLIKAWKYIFFETGGSQNPVETTGTGTVQWKIDSTDGTYYSYGGNMHLTGEDPLSDTVVNHEYGHNVMWNVYGAWFPTNDCPSPHYIQLYGGVHCGWTEGFADFFPMAVNNDPYYRWASGSSLNLETPTWGTSGWNNGAYVEGRVAGALWDILDTANDGDDTYSDGGIVNIWDTLYHHIRDAEFSTYWAGWLARGHNNTSAGPIMDLYQNTIDYRVGPINDDFADSYLPSFNINYNETTTGATTQGLDPVTACGSTSTPRQSRSVWFTLHPPTTRSYYIATDTSSFDTVLAIWTGSWGSLSSVGCNDDAGTLQSALKLPLTLGTTYYVEAMAYGNGTGGTLNIHMCYAPDIPSLTGPVDGKITNAPPTLTWSTPNTPDNTEVQIATDAGMSNIVVDASTTGTSYIPALADDGDYYWRARGRFTTIGLCNNVSDWSVVRHFVLDRVPPTGTIVVNGGSSYTTSPNVTLTLSATDDRSGVSQMSLGNTGGSWQPFEAYATSKAWTLFGSEGSNTVWVRFMDVAGNISTQSPDSIILDTVPPSGSILINAGATYATSPNVNLTLSATDATSGVSLMQFSNDGASWSLLEAYNTTKPWSLTAGEGTKTVFVRFKDAAGNTSGTFTDSIVVDTIAPSGSITINSGVQYTNSTSVLLTLSATDATSGLNRMRFSNDNVNWSGWQAYGTSKTWTLPSVEGTQTVYVQFDDNAGNASGNFTDTIILDTIAPSGTIIINSGSAFTTSANVSLALSAMDATSGLYQMRFSNDNATWSTSEAYGTSKAWTLAAGDGSKTVYVQYRDNAGNVSTSFTDTIILDTVAPTGSIVVNGGATYATSASVILTLSATDAGTGVSQMQFSNDGSSWSGWEGYNTSKNWNLTGADGNKVVFVQYRDGAGFVSSNYSDGIMLDTTPPSGSVLINSGAANTNTTAVSLTLSATDGTSGVNQMQFSNNGTTWSTLEGYSTSKAWDLTAGDGTKTVYVRFTDTAGNTSGSFTDTILLDTTAPSGTIIINGGAAYANSLSAILTLSASDAGSGVNQMQFSNDGSTWSTLEGYSTSKTWNLIGGDGSKTVYVRYRDNAGNTSGNFTDSITLDMTPPTGSVIINAGADYTTSASVNLTLSANDTGSGLDVMRFSNDTATWSMWEAYGTNKVWTLSGSDGTKTVYVQFRDVIGNVSTNYTDTIVLDTTAPSGTIVINAGAAFTNSTSVNLTLSATDTGTGVSQMQFSNDGSSWSGWESYATSKSWSIIGGDGSKVVYVQYRDAAGIASGSFTDSITLDTVLPTSSASSPAQSVNLSFTVSWSGSDNASGIAGYDVQYRIGAGGTWTDWMHTSAPSAVFGATSPVVVVRGETYYFRVRAYDGAGNVESYPGGDGDTSTYISIVFFTYTPSIIK
jgi:hypothetical protein